MRKLLTGIVEFQRNLSPEYRQRFAQLALGQSPDTLLITCSDSRVAPNVFASTDPGDLFVIRNVGNLVAPCGPAGVSSGDIAEAAAIEFAIQRLKVRDIVICGHSECGAMQAITYKDDLSSLPNLKVWLSNGGSANGGFTPQSTLSPHNQLSQRNVLMQMKNVMSYPAVRDRVEQGVLKVHGWWFDIAQAEVRGFDADAADFVVIDNAFVEKAIKTTR